MKGFPVILIAGLLVLSSANSFAQIKVDVKKKVNQQANQRANQRTNQAIDKGFDKLEEGIGCARNRASWSGWRWSTR